MAAKPANKTMIDAIKDRIKFTADWSDEGKNELASETDPARKALIEDRLQVLKGIAEQLENAKETLGK